MYKYYLLKFFPLGSSTQTVVSCYSFVYLIKVVFLW